MLASFASPPESRFWLSSSGDIVFHSVLSACDDVDYLPHSHPEYNFTFCLTRFACVVGGVRINLGSGEAVVTHPGELHGDVHGGGPSPGGLTMVISVRAMNQAIRSMGDRTYPKAFTARFPSTLHADRYMPLVHRLTEEMERRPAGCDIMIDSLARQLLAYLLRDHPPHLCASPGGLSRRLPFRHMVRTLEYMSACAKSDFNLAQLCRTIGLSSSLFIQLFKRSSDGLSPAAYFNRLVMAKARRLLRTTDWPVKNVAYELGFQNDSHFCRVFHASFGMSPGAFRESTVREMVCAPQPEPPIPPGPCAQRLVVRDDRRLTALAKMGSSRDTSTLAAAILKGPVMPSANAGRLVAARRHSLELIAGGNRP